MEYCKSNKGALLLQYNKKLLTAVSASVTKAVDTATAIESAASAATTSAATAATATTLASFSSLSIVFLLIYTALIMPNDTYRVLENNEQMILNFIRRLLCVTYILTLLLLGISILSLFNIAMIKYNFSINMSIRLNKTSVQNYMQNIYEKESIIKKIIYISFILLTVAIFKIVSFTIIIYLFDTLYLIKFSMFYISIVLSLLTFLISFIISLMLHNINFTNSFNK